MATTQTLDGDNISNLREYLHDEENVSFDDFEQILQTSSEIFQRCLEPENNGNIIGLIYGHIQSGKTSIILTTMALAADNGYNNFIIMTSNLNDIYEQTLQRIKGALDSFQVFGKKELTNNFVENPGFPLALVTPKDRRRLNNVLNITQQLNWSNQTVLVIDDEADQASLDTNINNQNKPTSAVNQAICDLRTALNSHTYLQTTATPQALLLQDDNSNFRPDFVVVTNPGTGYVGGDYFFGQNFQDSDHIRTVSEIDVDLLKTTNHIPPTVKQSLLVFFLGAAILRLKIPNNKKKYTYLLHTSFRKEDHHLAYVLVEQFKNQLSHELKQTNNNLAISPQLRIDLEAAYNDLQQTFFEEPPTFTKVIAETARRISSTEVIEINSSTGEGINPNPSRKHTLYIGGTKIGRGVTVKNLLVTYYGRDAQQPQMDTVLQHARMYGYRQDELPAIRIYLPERLAERFHRIHISDNLVREQCQSTHKPIKTIPLIIQGVRPSRRNVLNDDTVALVTYQGGRQYFPSLPNLEPHILADETQVLDQILSDFQYPDLQTPYQVTIDNLLEILNFSFANPEINGTWKDELIRQAISALRDNPIYQNQGTLVIVNRSADIGKSGSRNYGIISTVLPGNSGNPPYGIDPNFPALLMTRNQGNPLKGWNGEPFWIPVIRFPNGNYAFSVNYS